ncbi:winged helix-turn-helix transcriptional regulator [Nocardia cyriacigeorgica]|uniref:Winged helix-turn-helix transcriptional regulator n=1 Tax=Nocardia cyriacigeorgica TaxID=135487 RepID=A0A6P1DAK3_9NOCA|nr:MarR family winged helix-turn-helix transcriptional regulator [Nocardia cyriacigeorgica]NEW40230.1 winged helix-turn-helix transcriptional regulator [Nocardia cyriacigeorgica]NEW46649.1 winged helix-turn-helix transcriptional regulator [Nocardia cyriacigeorgica]NEW50823.1 winged helix-turn-helix transcriptional regulator [Nocardia cyriacigeorgica]NEW58959.1 winged helix-turn-helix transcriptional regulator [Nocardia cyriacigeorgica]
MSDSGDFGSAAEKPLSGLSFELTLLSRHTPASRHPRFQLDRSAFLILTRLDLGCPLSLRELAEALRLDISTVNRQVGAMLDQGLVERVPDPDGGVARKVRPSDKGRELLDADRTVGRDGIGRVVADWPAADVEQLHQLISRFNQSVERLEGNPWPRPSS